MMKRCLYFLLFLISVLALLSFKASGPGSGEEMSWIRVNLLGYQTHSVKVAVWATKEEKVPKYFELIDRKTGHVAYTSTMVKTFGAYGPFRSGARLVFSGFKKPGRYRIRAEGIYSPEIIIGDGVYRHSADFVLKYMRQQRSGFNPYLKDSCHTRDGYTMYGPMPDSTHVDVSGGWHDASDYLQYSTTSANATYHLLAAYRDFPQAFGDQYAENGLEGKNGVADVLDEAKWGLQWLLKMHPRPDWLFNQIADDRDHSGMRLPTRDSADYGKGRERPVYFANGKVQGLGKFKNRATGAASIAGKFSSAFALGSKIFGGTDYGSLLKEKALTAYAYGLALPGTQQTAPMRAPYFYEEDNWTDDMELAAAQLYGLGRDNIYLSSALAYAEKEPVTPWMGADTAKHYQWYPFHNFGHYELARTGGAEARKKMAENYRQGMEKVWTKARQNVFYRGVPFIWCSNNLTASFAIQGYLYQQLTGDRTYEELVQANFDWLFGCNPWGTSFVAGLPEWADSPSDPHSAFSHLNHYPVDGGLVDGPVYGSLYRNLIGIKLYEPDEYAAFQSDLVVYHDDYGDYSSNEPTMDGTASMVYLLAAFDSREGQAGKPVMEQGAMIRGSATEKKIALVFTGDEFAEGGVEIHKTLQKQQVKASFFLTGRFYRNPAHSKLIRTLKNSGYYMGPHSDGHLLYCDWNKRDSLLISKAQFVKDLEQNIKAMAVFGIPRPAIFLPPYEWYNEEISKWTKEEGMRLICFTPGTRSNADYSWPEMGSRYRSSGEIYDSIMNYEQSRGLNGFILLLHIGTDPRRKDKFYDKLDRMIGELKARGYEFVRINHLPGLPGVPFLK